MIKLYIKRVQSEQKGLLGGNQGVKLYLSWHIELTPEEKNLIDKYNAEIYLYGFTRGSTKGHDIISVPKSKDMIKSLIEGYGESGDVNSLLNDENIIKEGCRDFKAMLYAYSAFGGEEVIDI